MKTKVTNAVLLSSALLCSTAYAEDIKLYGRAHLGIQSSDVGEGRETDIESYASRLGVLSNHKVNDSLEAVFRFEWEVNVTEQDNDGAKAENLTARDQYVGLKGNFGEIMIGRMDTTMKKSENQVDVMNDFAADIKVLFNGENRLGDSIRYESPLMGEVKFLVTYVAKENSKQNDENGISAAVTYGDSKLKRTNVYLALARDEKVAGYTVTRLTGQFQLGDLMLGGMYQDSEKDADGTDGDGYMFSASYKIDDYKLLGQYQHSDMAFGKLKDTGDAASLGVERKLSKQARMYLLYSMFNMDTIEDQDHLAVTLRYDF